MKLIVGLGNPGQKYENTRHNCGFFFLNNLAQKLKVELNRKKFNGYYYQTSEYILLKPQTYMNNSGECIRNFVKHFHLALENILVIYDEIALPLGKFRYRQQGSAGGHNGLKNIIDCLKTKNFARLRIGVGYERNFTLSEWVLGEFSKAEEKELMNIRPKILSSLLEWIEGINFSEIMNKYNSKV